MYTQIWVSDSTIEDAIDRVIDKAKVDGFKVLFAQGEVQRNLFSTQEDVLVILEVERASKE